MRARQELIEEEISFQVGTAFLKRKINVTNTTKPTQLNTAVRGVVASGCKGVVDGYVEVSRLGDVEVREGKGASIGINRIPMV